MTCHAICHNLSDHIRSPTRKTPLASKAMNASTTVPSSTRSSCIRDVTGTPIHILVQALALLALAACGRLCRPMSGVIAPGGKAYREHTGGLEEPPNSQSYSS
jgi:hypothetical protein